MKVERDVVYDGSHGRGVGDVFVPLGGAAGAPVLLIHGGGWNAMAKESIEPFARLMAAEGRAVFNVNYRLLDHGPWPACLEDCVAAARFVLGGGLAERGAPAPEALVVCGASAGGHLAMMTGLALPAERVESIVSISGPSRFVLDDGSSTRHFQSAGFCAKFFGSARRPTAEELAAVSPCLRVSPGAPRLVCVHSRNDELVPIFHSRDAVAAWREAGSPAALVEFDGPGKAHGLWDGDDLETRQPIAEVAEIVRGVFRGRGRG